MRSTSVFSSSQRACTIGGNVAENAGGPHTLAVAGKNKLELGDVLIGEGWLCAGQSNMEMGIRSVADGEKEVAAAGLPQIRLLMIPNVPAAEPQDDVEASWQVCSPESVAAVRESVR